MSAVYNLEPQPTAKLLLNTTAGDIEIELFAKQTPLTSRNFLQLCLDGYYNGTIFHRLVPGFIIQGGDPTGTGSGGESSYDGEPFADEFHSRLKFNRRGLLGMANSGKDDNGSQFFFTLGNTPELTGKNTMFGRVAGDTIYNLMKMGEAELAEAGGDRPLYPTKITGAEILVNPFEDLAKRVRIAERTKEEKRTVKKPKRKAGKALLSFGGEEGEEGIGSPVVKKAKFNTRLVSAGEEKPEKLNNTTMPKAPETEKAIPIRKPSRASPSPPPPSKAETKATPLQPPKPSKKQPSKSPSSSPEPSPERETQQSLLDRTNAQIAALKESMRRNTAVSAAAPTTKKSALEAMIPVTSTKGRKRKPGGTGDQGTLDLLAAFKSKLEAAPAESRIPASESPAPLPASDAMEITPNGNAHVLANETTANTTQSNGAEEEVTCDLHFIVNCQSCTAWDNQVQDESDDDAGWMSHALTFAKDRLGKDLEWKRKNEEELIVIDPREKAKELKAEKRDKRDRDRAKDGTKVRDRR